MILRFGAGVNLQSLLGLLLDHIFLELLVTINEVMALIDIKFIKLFLLTIPVQ